MPLDRGDRDWIAKLVAIAVRVIVAANIGPMKTVIAADGAKRIEEFGRDPHGRIDDWDNEGYRKKAP